MEEDKSSTPSQKQATTLRSRVSRHSSTIVITVLVLTALAQLGVFVMMAVLLADLKKLMKAASFLLD
jgi:hypothetical protein